MFPKGTLEIEDPKPAILVLDKKLMLEKSDNTFVDNAVTEDINSIDSETISGTVKSLTIFVAA